MRRWLYNVLVGFDMFGNTLFGGLPDETISAHVGRLRKKKGLARLLAWILDKIQKDHVEEAIQGDEHRASVVEDLEKNAEETR